MDPTATLGSQRRHAARIVELQEELARLCDANDAANAPRIRNIEASIVDHADALAALVVALDSWIVGGGFLPGQWQK